MCQLKNGEVMHVVALRLTATGVQNIDLGRQFEHVKEIRLAEYHVLNPNGGALTPSVWKLKFSAEHFYPYETTNAAGGFGSVIVINDAACTHVLYHEHPRVLSKANRGRLSHVEVGLFTETGANASFTDATIFLHVICHDPAWVPERIIWEDHNGANVPGLQFDSRARFNRNNGLG